MKKILIIGHKGYVGTVLTKHLIKIKKYRKSIYGIDTNLYKLNKYSKFKKFSFLDLNADYRNIDLSKINPKPDVIIFLAAVSNDPMGKKFRRATKDINFLSCLRLAKAAKKINIKKFIFASSCSMYGASGNSLKKENDILQPLTDYAKSKVSAEKELKKISTKDFKIISLRFATAAGLSDNLRLDLVFNDFVANAVLNKEIELLSSGTAWRPLIHVNDMAKAIKWAIEYNFNKDFLSVNIGSDKWNFRIIDLAKRISNIIKGVKLKISDSNVDKRSYRVNFKLFKKIAPKHQPTMKFKNAVKELEFFLKKESYSLKNFRSSPKWSRLSCLNHLIKKKKLNDKLIWITNK